MCHFVTAILPKSANLALLRDLMAPYQRQLEPLVNESITRQLLPTEGYYLTTPKGANCDCGVGLGWFSRRQKLTPRAVDVNAATTRLKRKGWSEAKISRWLSQKAADRATWTTPVDLESDTYYVKDWHALLSAVLNSGHTSYIGLLLHMYSGPLSQRIQLKGRVNCNLEHGGYTTLSAMAEDTLYVFGHEP